MKQLYCVEVTIYVAAEDEQDARDAADTAFCMAMVEPGTFEVELADSVLDVWYDAIPFGADYDETCIQIIKRCRGKE